MKKQIFFAMAMVAAMSLNAQEPVQYTQKLDSVVGSYDFDLTRFKKIFTYYETDGVIQEDTYTLENGEWTISGEVIYNYETNDFQQLYGTIVVKATEEGLQRVSLTEYEYDDLNHLTLVMNYVAADTVWAENSKYVYSYNDDGLLDTCVYSTIRNGNWRETERTIYTYDESQQCTSLLAQRKGGWGPFGDNWMDSYRYDFEYEDGELARELYYVTVGWFGSNMALDSQVEYEFDANGNLLRKTASITNDSKDWIVRDVYENQYDLSVDASTVMGLQPFWASMGKNGMNYATGAAVPLQNLWKSCSIISTNLDTEFIVYCSGFEGVEEEQMTPMKAYAFDGRLRVTNDQPADVTVYDLLGRVVASQKQALQCEFSLTPGLYIVGSGNARVKVIVK